MLIEGPGKSSLTVQFVDGVFVESYYPTIENTFSKVIKYKGQEYATEIIDTAGQVRKDIFQL
jgi:Ras family protein